MSSKISLSDRKLRSRASRLGRAVEFQTLESRRLMSATITVNTFNDQVDAAGSKTVSLRDAITMANTDNGATINLPGGTYTLLMLDSNGNQLNPLQYTGSGALTINASSGTPILNPNQHYEGLDVDSGSATLNGIEIADGLANNGGGIYAAANVNLTLNNCVITDNTIFGGQGAGLWAGGNLTVNNSTIVNNGENFAASQGGGIYFAGNGYVLQITNSLITGNIAGAGGGVYDADTVDYGTFTSSTFAGNTATDDIANGTGDGGGIYTVSPAPTLTDVTVINNRASNDGGGLYLASNDGGADIESATVTGNSAAGNGGGIFSVAPTDGFGDQATEVGDSVVAENTSAAGVGSDYDGPVDSLGYNVIGIADDNDSTAGFGSVSTDQLGQTAFPLNPELSAPTGPLQVEVPVGENQQDGPDFGVASSPLIDQGGNAQVTTTTDGRGLTRIVNGTVDIGAAESQLTFTAAAPNQNVYSGVASTISLGSFSDAGTTGPYNVSVDWAQDGAPAVSFSVNSTGVLTAAATFDGEAGETAYTGDVQVTDSLGTVLVASTSFNISIVTQPSGPPQLTGTTIGTAGSYGNSGNTIAKATDGNINTFFDGASNGSSASNDNWVGLDLGSTGGKVTQVEYAPRSGFASRLVGGQIQASNSATFASGVVTLDTITATPATGSLTTATLTNTTAYRYYRYLSPNNSYGDIAEIQFFGTAGGLASGPAQLTGATIGTAGSYGNTGTTIAKATDGNLTTFFDGPTAGTGASSDNWVGVDLGASGGKVTQVEYAPRSSFANRMVGGTIQASNSANFASGVVTLYTISAAPATGSLTTATFTNTTAYRYYRYLSPNGSFGDVAEIQFFGTAGGLTGGPAKLTGTTIGTAGSYGNGGTTIANATDGNLATFFDGPSAGTSPSNDNWVGLDLGASGGVVTQAEYAPRSSFASRMVGGTIQASNNAAFSSGVVTLYTISATPVTGSLTTVTFTNTIAYRYYRYLSPNGSYGDIAEIQFFGTAGGHTGAPQLTGTTIGTAGSYSNSGTTIANATDGNLATFFDGPSAGTSASNDNWVGLDLGTAQIATSVQYAPRSSFASRMVGGEIQASNSATFSTGVVTLYTISATPATGSLTTAVFGNSTAYRYYRYLSPNGSYGDIAEIQFFGPSAV